MGGGPNSSSEGLEKTAFLINHAMSQAHILLIQMNSKHSHLPQEQLASHTFNIEEASQCQG